MKLYYQADCPYCQMVLRMIHAAGVDCELLPDTAHQDEVKTLGGTVPVLVDGGTTIAGSREIIDHLKTTHDLPAEVAANDYGMRVTFDGTVEAAEQAITEALKDAGFGVLTRIDVAATLKKKLDLDRPPYVILGACNPKIASQAIEMEPELGLLLPCNVIVYENAAGETVISIIKPVKMLAFVGRPEMLPLAEQVRDLLAQALKKVSG
ncbi:MAG: DUF302 domain-containing protein [Mariprofundaceae bacterium]